MSAEVTVPGQRTPGIQSEDLEPPLVVRGPTPRQCPLRSRCYLKVRSHESATASATTSDGVNHMNRFSALLIAALTATTLVSAHAVANGVNRPMSLAEVVSGVIP